MMMKAMEMMMKMTMKMTMSMTMMTKAETGAGHKKKMAVTQNLS
jgi:hypothetical protein